MTPNDIDIFSFFFLPILSFFQHEGDYSLLKVIGSPRAGVGMGKLLIGSVRSTCQSYPLASTANIICKTSVQQGHGIVSNPQAALKQLMQLTYSCKATSGIISQAYHGTKR